jgi:lipopolysaccharide/colanic/teichoic acid biosynthesis glycosyltransferase
VIEDARADPRVARMPAVCDGTVAAYLGMRLVTPDGCVVGTLSAMDGRPRRWSARDLDFMRRVRGRILAKEGGRLRRGAPGRRRQSALEGMCDEGKPSPASALGGHGAWPELPGLHGGRVSAWPGLDVAGDPVYGTPRVQGAAPGEAGPRASDAAGSGEGARRALNLVAAAALLLLVLPLLLVIAIAVKLSSPGPVFFIQERVGLDRRRRAGDRPILMARRNQLDRRAADAGGRLFRMYKFRTMYVSQGDTEQVWAQKDDPRITPVGRILRAFRLDEIPQLWNVLLGQMNVVGPRPEQPEIFRQIRSEMVDYSQRQRVLPGITGWAQINNGYDQTYRDVALKLNYDLEYLERRSAAEDLRS